MSQDLSDLGRVSRFRLTGLGERSNDSLESRGVNCPNQAFGVRRVSGWFKSGGRDHLRHVERFITTIEADGRSVGKRP